MTKDVSDDGKKSLGSAEQENTATTRSQEPGILVCYSTCWACKFDNHCDPPQWHSWMDDEDIEFFSHQHSGVAPTLTEHPCGCFCCPRVTSIIDEAESEVGG